MSKVFSTPALPSWGTLELLVEAMHGDVAHFHAHFHARWLDASTPAEEVSQAPRIAGRRAELAALGRHLTSGTGLVLVTGEAGIGKTTLAMAAARRDDAYVAVGRCLPLSASVPLMPVVDMLGRIHAVDDGRWCEQALATCPPTSGAS